MPNTLLAKKPFKRILVVRPDNIGDVIMLGPAVRALRENFPVAAITLMASPAGTTAAGLLPWIDDVITLRPLWQDTRSEIPQDPAREFRLVEELRRRNFDAVFIFTSFNQSPYPPAYITYLAGIPFRIGQSKEFGGSVLTHWVKPPPDDRHQTERNLHLLEQTGLKVTRRDLEIDIPADARSAGRRILYEAGIRNEPFVVVAPGASCASRRYDASRFAGVIRHLYERTGMPVVLAGSPRETALADFIMEEVRPSRTFSLAGRTSMTELAALIEECSLLIANNSGSIHLADALRVPMVILYSGSELEEQWSPRKAPFKLLTIPTACRPCHRFECLYSMECLDIDPAEAAEQAEWMLRVGDSVPSAG